MRKERERERDVTSRKSVITVQFAERWESILQILSAAIGDISSWNIKGRKDIEGSRNNFTRQM